MWKRPIEDLKNQVITTTTRKQSLQEKLEVETLKLEEVKDQTIRVLPLDAKARSMGSATTQVVKAWDTALVAIWNLQENLQESMAMT